MLRVISHRRIAGRVVRPRSLSRSQAGKKTVGPCRSAVGRSGPSDIGRAPGNDAPGLKRRHHRVPARQHVRLNLGRVLPG